AAVPVGTLEQAFSLSTEVARPLLFKLQSSNGRGTEVKLIVLYSSLVLLLSTTTTRAEDLNAALHAALDAQATAPSRPATLPETASGRAELAQQNKAHGEHGEQERSTHAQQSAAAAASHIDGRANTAAAHRSAQAAAASAAQSADTDSHEAAGQA